MIGLSISECIRDMAAGIIDPASVKKIIGRTYAETPEDIEWLEHYYGDRAGSGIWGMKDPKDFSGKSYSRAQANRAVRIFRQMMAEGRIEQPRLQGKPCPSDFETGHWVKSAKKIRWRDFTEGKPISTPHRFWETPRRRRKARRH